MSGIKIVGELVPNGTTYTVVDINNVKGGLHYAENENEMRSIHESRLSPGILCYVKTTDAYYTYDFEVKDWVKSAIGQDSKFVCTLDSVKPDDMTSASTKLGNLPLMSRKALEEMTINQILTRALFKEEPPYFNYTAPKISTPSIEVGTILTSNQWISTDGSFDYGYNDSGVAIVEATKKGTITIKMGTLKSGQTAAVGTNAPTFTSNKVIISYNPSVTLNNINATKTSWGRILKEYNDDNNTNKSMPLLPTFNISPTYTGFYKIYYAYGKKGEEQIKTTVNIADDVPDINLLLTLINTNSPNTTKFFNLQNITKKDITTVQIGADKKDSMLNTSFVYIILPSALKIDSASMRNDTNGLYEQIPNTRINKVADKVSGTYLINRIVNNTTLYTYDLWCIAKGDWGAQGYPQTGAPLQINIKIK